MRVPPFLKLALVACLGGCALGPQEPAMLVVVTIDPQIPATCVVLELISRGEVLATDSLVRPPGKNSFRVGIVKGQLPTALQLIARSFNSTADCAEPQARTAQSAPVEAKFPAASLATFTVEIHPPAIDLDADGDLYIDAAKGGDDCNDQDNGIHPGVAAACSSKHDNDCDGKVGCADSECVGTAGCALPPVQLAFANLPLTVPAGVCSGLLTVQAASSLIVADEIALSSNQTGVQFFTDGACTASVTAPLPIAAGTNRRSFFVRGTSVLPTTLTATLVSAPAVVAAQSYTVTAGPAAKLAFLGQPSGAVAGAPIAPPIRVAIRDAFDNPVPSATAGVTLVLDTNPTMGILSGTLSATAVAGIATFTTVALDKSGAGYQLGATSGTLTRATSALFDIAPGPATGLVFSTQPTTTGAGVGIAPAVRVTVVDALGNPDSASTAIVTLAIGANPAGGVLSGTASAAAVAGVATFAGLSIDRAGTGYTLAATAPGLAAATSASFNITAVTAAVLSFSVQPNTATSGAAVAPAPQVTVRDAFGNLVTGSAASITVAIGTNPGAGILSGAVTALAAAGVAAFPGLAIDKAGTGYTLVATSPGLAPGTSAAFNILVGPPAKLAILGLPVTVPALDCSPARTVQLQDTGGNPVASAGPTPVTYAATPPAAGTAFYSDPACTLLTTPMTRRIPNGASQVSFFFLAQNPTAALTLTASSGGLTSGVQTASIAPAVVTDLAFTTAAPTLEAGFCQALTLERQDKLGRPTNAASATTVSLDALPATGIRFFTEATCTAALGATFNVLAGSSSTVLYTKGGSGSLTGTAPGPQVYGLTASATGLNDAALNVTVLPMVRRRSAPCTLSTGTTSCPITPALARSDRTVLFFQATPGDADDSASDDNVTCQLSPGLGGVEVICSRFGNGANVDIEWQTVSFPYSYANGGVSVQHLEGGCVALAPNAMPIATAISAVPTAESFVLFSSRSTDLDDLNDGQHFFAARLTSATNLSVLQSDPSTTCVTSMGFTAQVVSWAGASVTRAVTAGGPGASFQVAQPTAPLARAFLLYSSRMTGDVAVTNDNICFRRLQGSILNASTLAFDRGCTGADIQDIGWEHVVLPAGASVQQVVGALATGETSSAVAIAPVDLTRSFSFIGGTGQGGTASGRTDYATNGRIGAALARPVLSSNVEVTFTRASTSGNSAFTGYVIQLTP